MPCLSHLLCSLFGSALNRLHEVQMQHLLNSRDFHDYLGTKGQLPTATTALCYFHEKWLGCTVVDHRNQRKTTQQSVSVRVYVWPAKGQPRHKLTCQTQTKYILTTTKYYLPINDTNYIDRSRQKYNLVLDMSHKFVPCCLMRSMISPWHRKMQMCRQWPSQIHCMESMDRKWFDCKWHPRFVGTLMVIFVGDI